MGLDFCLFKDSLIYLTGESFEDLALVLHVLGDLLGGLESKAGCILDGSRD